MGGTGLHILKGWAFHQVWVVGEVLVVSAATLFLWDHTWKHIGGLRSVTGLPARYGIGMWVVGAGVVMAWAAANRAPALAVSENVGDDDARPEGTDQSVPSQWDVVRMRWGHTNPVGAAVAGVITYAAFATVLLLVLT